MSGIKFSFKVAPSVVEKERSQLDIRSLGSRGIRRLAEGQLLIIAEEPRQSIEIESEIIDYLDQLMGVVQYLDSGNTESFTVSADYFSNNLRFLYDRSTMNLTIKDVNNGERQVTVPYNDFRQSFLKFYKQATRDLEMLYPELSENKEFLAMAAR